MGFKTIIIIIIGSREKSVYSFNAFNYFVLCVMHHNYVNIERIILTYKLRTRYIKLSRCLHVIRGRGGNIGRQTRHLQLVQPFRKSSVTYLV